MNKIEKIRQEIKRWHDYENEMYHKKNPDGRPNYGWAESLAIMGVLEELLTFLDTLSEEPDRPEPYTGKYDEAYLNEKIKKASEHWKGVDVDKMLAECRGYDEEPDKSLEESGEEEKDAEVILNGHGLLVDVTKWADGYKLKIKIYDEA